MSTTQSQHDNDLEWALGNDGSDLLRNVYLFQWTVRVPLLQEKVRRDRCLFRRALLSQSYFAGFTHMIMGHATPSFLYGCMPTSNSAHGGGVPGKRSALVRIKVSWLHDLANPERAMAMLASVGILDAVKRQSEHCAHATRKDNMVCIKSWYARCGYKCINIWIVPPVANQPNQKYA